VYPSAVGEGGEGRSVSIDGKGNQAVTDASGRPAAYVGKIRRGAGQFEVP
jgi:hypothetical protein